MFHRNNRMTGLWEEQNIIITEIIISNDPAPDETTIFARAAEDRAEEHDDQHKWDDSRTISNIDVYYTVDDGSYWGR